MADKGDRGLEAVFAGGDHGTVDQLSFGTWRAVAATDFSIDDGNLEVMLKFMRCALRKLPLIGQAFRDLDQFRKVQYYPPGHFYSPIPCQEEVISKEQAIWGAVPKSLPSIELNEKGQLSLFDVFRKYYNEMPFEHESKQNTRYYFDNIWFTYADAIVLYSMIRHLRPKRIIEIGSGFSSAVILDTNDLFFGGEIACTFVEPNPNRLLSLLKKADLDQHSLITKRLQDVDLKLFEQLSENDILFVDSSHVSKVGSDVNRIFFDVLPVLGNKVSVHFHDVFYPFEYPKEWVYEGRAWNESYILRAFLQYNRAFEIQFFNSFLIPSHHDLFQSHMPLCLKDSGGSIWLRKNVSKETI